MKKLLSILLAITLIAAAIPVASALEYDFWDDNGYQNRFYYEDNGDGTCRITEFYGFKATEIFIPLQINGLTVTSIEEEAFANKTSLTLISIPAGVLSIGRKAFSGCTNLSSVILGNGVRVIFDQAFENCTALTGIHLRNVEAIGQMCFYNCTALTSINSNNLLTFIGARAFWKCEALNFVRFSNKLETISDYAFKDCIALTTLTFPASLIRIGIGAFQGCTAVESINFGTGAIVIDGCVNYGKIVAPGIAGGIGEGLLIRKGEIVRKVPEEQLLHALKEELDKYYNITSYILVSDLYLWQQYEDFLHKYPLLDIAALKGQTGNYCCMQNGEDIKNADCRMSGLSWASLFNKSNIEKYNYDCALTCEYVNARRKAIKSNVCIITYQLFLLTSILQNKFYIHKGDIKMEDKFFHRVSFSR